MEVSQFVDALRADLAAVADLGDEATAEAARRLTAALEASVALRLVEALSSLALEVSAQLPAGHVEVRLAGRTPELVYVEHEPGDAPERSDASGTARITLRVPQGLKASIEAAAAREGVSTNAWLVRALARAVNPPRRRPGNRLSGFGKS